MWAFPNSSQRDYSRSPSVVHSSLQALAGASLWRSPSACCLSQAFKTISSPKAQLRTTARGAGATPAPPRADPPARRVGPAPRRAAPVRGGAGTAGRRPGQVVGARRHALDAPARGAERVPRVRPGATLRRAAPLPLPHPRGSRSPLKLKSRRHLLFLIYALLATTTMLFSKEQPDLRTGAALCRASW